MCTTMSKNSSTLTVDENRAEKENIQTDVPPENPFTTFTHTKKRSHENLKPEIKPKKRRMFLGKRRNVSLTPVAQNIHSITKEIRRKHFRTVLKLKRYNEGTKLIMRFISYNIPLKYNDVLIMRTILLQLYYQQIM